MKRRVHQGVLTELRARRSAEPLVRSCEAFLAGYYGAFLEHAGRSRPSWTWLNTLAHGDGARIARLARTGPDAEVPRCAQTPWDHAVSLLALEIMTAVDEDLVLLAALQREVLVPLEASWMAGRAGSGSPRQLVAQVLTSLDARRNGTPTARLRDVQGGSQALSTFSAQRCAGSTDAPHAPHAPHGRRGQGGLGPGASAGFAPA